MSGWDFKRKGCEILQRHVGVAQGWFGREGDHSQDFHVLGAGLHASHTGPPLPGCGEDVGVPLPVTQDETGSLWLCDLLSQMTIVTTTGPFRPPVQVSPSCWYWVGQAFLLQC